MMILFCDRELVIDAFPIGARGIFTAFPAQVVVQVHSNGAWRANLGQQPGSLFLLGFLTQLNHSE